MGCGSLDLPTADGEMFVIVSQASCLAHYNKHSSISSQEIFTATAH